MGRRKGPPKDEFSDLSDTFKEAVAGMDVETIRKRISDIALLDMAEHKMLKDDGAVSSAKESLKNLQDPYRENFKAYKAQIAFCKRVLDDKNGGATSANAEALRDDHKAANTTNLPS